MQETLSDGAPPSEKPRNGRPQIELDQLGRQPLETCCIMSSINLGTRVARCLSEFMSANMLPQGAFGGLQSPN